MSDITLLHTRDLNPQTRGRDPGVSQVLAFERFEVRVAERSVVVDGVSQTLGARAFDVLLALAERHDRVVSKAELMDLAWPGVVVEENNLTVQVSALRKLLGAATIATVVGRGYRLTVSPRSTVALPASATPHAATRPRLQRRLAAVVQADVVGWARLVARDATRAAAAWKQIRIEQIEKTAPAYGARPIELTAERVQLEFGSAVDAVEWSLDLQESLAQQRQANAGLESATASVHMRIGIAVDDAIVDDGRLVGDGVNVAADLQHSAGHDEILVTHKVRDFTADKLDAVFDAQGERVLQRLQRPVQVFRVDRGNPGRAGLRPGTLARVASLAVLPFSADGPEVQGYFGDGVTEEVIATLSLNRALFVIAHSSTLRYRTKPPNLAAAADELGVRYLVTGSVQRAGERLRIRASLVFAPDQRVLWQERFDGTVEDVFAFQTDIATAVAAAVAPRVEDEEVARVRTRPTDRYDAYDCVLRALAGIYQLGSPGFALAGELLERATRLDPGYAQAHAHLAWWYSLLEFEGRDVNRDHAAGDAATLALEHALQAVRLDPRDAWALSVAGYMQSLLNKRHDDAMAMFEQALAINPSCAAAWARSAATLSYLGRADDAMDRIRRAMQLSPFDPHRFWHLTICGGSAFVAARYDEAAAWLAQALQLNPLFNGARRVRVAALALLGELTEARELAEQLMSDTPDFKVDEFALRSPMSQPHLDHLIRGLRLAGLPG